MSSIRLLHTSAMACVIDAGEWSGCVRAKCGSDGLDTRLVYCQSVTDNVRAVDDELCDVSRRPPTHHVYHVPDLTLMALVVTKTSYHVYRVYHVPCTMVAVASRRPCTKSTMYHASRWWLWWQPKTSYRVHHVYDVYHVYHVPCASDSEGSLRPLTTFTMSTMYHASRWWRWW